MKKGISVLFLLFAMFSCARIYAQSTKSGEFNTKIVRNLVKIKKAGFDFSYYSKQNLRLGDNSARALLNIFSEDEILMDKNLSICLSIIQNSFAYPNAVDKAKDRKPIKTFLLLERLKKKAGDSKSIDLINQTIRNIKKQTAAVKPLS